METVAVKPITEIPVLFKGCRIVPMTENDFELYKPYRDSLSSEPDSYINPMDEETFKVLLGVYSMTSKKAYLVWKNGEVVGELFLSILVKGEKAFINLVAVEKKHRKFGLGKTLVTLAETVAKKAGCVGLDLSVERENTEVISFYRRLGFKEIRLFNGTIGMSKKF